MPHSTHELGTAALPQGAAPHLTARPAGGFTEAEWERAVPWGDYLAALEDKRDVWESNWRRARISDDAAARLAALPGRRRVLVLTEDWCGDAARAVPYLAKAFAAAPDVDARYLGIDGDAPVMQRYLTHGGRSIPIAVVQEESGNELGAWGPRPAPLQALFRARRRELGAPTPDTRSEFYAPIMRWYAQDKGQAVVDEVLMLLERGGAPR